MIKQILNIDTDLQVSNRIKKDNQNRVTSILDKAQNIPFTTFGTSKDSVYTYDRGLFFDNGSLLLADNPNLNFDNDFTVRVIADVTNNVGVQYLFDYRSRVTDGTNFGQGMVMLILNAAIHFRYATSVGTSWTIDLNFTSKIFSNTKYEIVAVRKNNVIGLFLDGVLLGKANVTGGLAFSNNDRVFVVGGTKDNASYYYGYLPLLEASKYGIVDVDSFSPNDVAFTPSYEPFTFYKRYANKSGNIKAFLSSRYLKDAVINSSDEITSIKDEVGNVFGDFGVTPKIKVTNKGFLNSSDLSLLRANMALGIADNDFYFGCWFKRNAGETDGVLMTDDTGFAMGIYQNKLTIWLTALGSTLWDYVIQSTSTLTEEYNHGGWLRFGDSIYLFINGVFDTKFDLPIGYSLDVGSTLVIMYFDSIYSFQGYADDFFISVGDSIINPTGYSVGQKVFEPPKRRSLKVKQYEGRELVNKAVAKGSAKAYLNSKYLENSVIDGTTGEITSIKDELGTTWTGTNGVKLDKRGFLFNTANLNSLSSGYAYGVLSNVTTTYIGFWAKFTSNNTFQNAFTLGTQVGGTSRPIEILWQNDGRFRIYSVTSQFYSANTYANNTYYYVTVLFDDSKFYLFINGVLDSTHTAPFSNWGG